MGGVPLMTRLLLFTTLLGAAAAGSWIAGPDGPVVGLVGDDLQLPCHVKSRENAVDEEIIWKRGDQMVHHYLRHTDRTEQQLPEYRGRTSVSREALQNGDASLKLTNLRLSDAGTYTCRVRADTWYDDAEVTVNVEAVGSTPALSAESLLDGRVRLRSESEGWSTEPQVMWLDSRGQQIPADSTCFERLPSGLRVTSIITVKETDDNNFTCVVKSAAQRREQPVEVPRAPGLGYTADCSSGTCDWSNGLKFQYPRRHYMIIISPLLLVLAMAGIVYRLGYGADERAADSGDNSAKDSAVDRPNGYATYHANGNADQRAVYYADNRASLCGGRQRVKVETAVDLSAADDITLYCQLVPAEGATEGAAEGTTVEWREGSEQICMWSGGHVTVNQPYADRVTAAPWDEKRGMASLRLRKMTANQATVYTAYVTTQAGTYTSRVITGPSLITTAAP